MIRSMVSKRFALALVCAAALSTGLAACGGDDDDDSGGSGSGSATEADGGSAAVTIEGFEFSAQPVAAGSSFEVDNRDSAAHTFTADDGAFDVEVDGGDSAAVDAPADAGTYAFHCKIHTDMTGELVVE
jgi:plastocyanin